LPAVEINKTVDYILQIGNQTWTGKFKLSPAKKWRTNFVEHTRTDIGYTRM